MIDGIRGVRGAAGVMLIVVALGLVIAPHPLRASSSASAQPLALSSAAAMALRNFPSIRATAARHDAAEREVGEAVAGRYPSVSLGASAIRYEEPMLATPIHGFTPGTQPRFDDLLLQGALTSEWLLVDGGGRGARIAERRALADAAGSDLRAAEALVIQRTIVAYLRVIGTASTLSAHDRRIEALDSELDRARQLSEVGRVARVELLRAEAAQAAATAERVRLASALDVAERDLARLTGLDPVDTRAAHLISPPLVEAPLPARDACRNAAHAANAALHVAELRERAAASSLRAGRAARWPALLAVGNALHYGTPNDVRATEWNAGLRVQFPLFTGGALSSRIGRAEAASRTAASEAHLQRLRLDEEIDRSAAMAEEARSRRASLTRAVARYEEVARIEKLRLETETGTQTDWLDAEALVLTARAQLIEADHAEIAARAELARLTGELDVHWIARTLEAQP
jgi:outer membrane protein TolC